MLLRFLPSKKQDAFPIREDYQAGFYKDYHKVSEEYDREFLKKYDEDLNITLIFVSLSVLCYKRLLKRGWQAGLFSAVASAFIIDVDPQLQPNPNADTAALLRVLIYKIDNTTFGNDIPTLPQWTGPPSAMIYVQAMLFASLVASLFSAFLAMLGKQWLSRYDAADMRGSAIQRGQNRQQKLDGIVAWYFDHVIESLPLLLQFSLLLLGCALSRYLWEIDITLAAVVIGITSFATLFYLLISIAGTVSENCPYQTPGSHAIHFLRVKVGSAALVPSVIGMAGSTLKNASMKSRVIRTIAMNLKCYHPWWPVGNVVPFFKDIVSGTPGAFANDCYHLRQSVIRTLVAFPTRVGRLVRRVYRRFYDPLPNAERRLTQKTIALELRCISWILQTSLDKAIHISTFKHLMSMPELAYFDPTLVVDCFNIFISCVNVVNCEAVTMQGLEELATVSARSLFRTFHRLSVVDPNSNVLTVLRQRYNKIFPSEDIDFTSLPFRYTMLMIHALFKRRWSPCYLKWDRPTTEEQLPFARYMAEAAQMGYQLMEHKKVPRWILRFALFTLSLDPPSPAPVMADCLAIIATDLGCDISNTVAMGDRYA